METETKYTLKKEHLKSIEKYLISEKISGNFPSVLNSFKRNELIVLFNKSEIVGFSAYEVNYPISKINVLEIKKEYREKGFGKKLANDTLREIEKRKGEVVELYCSPASSETFWKKIGFLNFPTFPYEDKIMMYKIIINSLISKKPTNDKNNKILLWECGSHRIEKEKPKYEWTFSYDNGNFKINKPIIQPAWYKWNIRVILNGKVLIDKEIKRIKNNKIEFGNFLIIKELEL